MKIVTVETFALVLSKDDVRDTYAGQQAVAHRGYMVKPPWRSLYSPGTETLLVKLTTDTGQSGWGEALAPVAPEVPATIVELLLAPLILGEDPLQTSVLQHRMTESMRERGHLVGHQADAMAAVDIALWDLRGHIEQRSVSQMLGGTFTTDVPAYVSGLVGATDELRAAHAAQLFEEGIRSFKLHLGSGVEQDLATFDAVRTAAPTSRIAVDAHWSYGLGEAKMLGAGLDSRGAWFFEAPLAPEDVEGHRELAQSIGTPIAVGEALRNRFEFADWLGRRAVQIVQPDVGRTGITEAAAISTLANASHARVAPHHSAALGLALAAGVHVAAATSSLEAFEFQPRTIDTANSILTTPLAATPAGHFSVPSGPGLGVDVDEDLVRRLARTTSVSTVNHP
jgi:D-galactarolactone cycloisomerase